MMSETVTPAFSEISAQDTALAAQEAQEWIEAVTGRTFGSSFRKSLEDGVVLCELMTKLIPDSIRRINRAKSPIAHLDNIQQFLSACKELGLKDAQLFDKMDLQEIVRRSKTTGVKRNEADRRIRSVCITLYWLGQTIAEMEDYSGPQLDLDAFKRIMYGNSTVNNVNSNEIIIKKQEEQPNHFQLNVERVRPQNERQQVQWDKPTENGHALTTEQEQSADELIADIQRSVDEMLMGFQTSPLVSPEPPSPAKVSNIPVQPEHVTVGVAPEKVGLSISMNSINGGFGFRIVGGRDVNAEMIPQVDLVATGLAADEAGLKEGDQLVSVNKKDISSLNHEELVAMIKKAGAEGSVMLGVIRTVQRKETDPPKYDKDAVNSSQKAWEEQRREQERQAREIALMYPRGPPPTVGSRPLPPLVEHQEEAVLEQINELLESTPIPPPQSSSPSPPPSPPTPTLSPPHTFSERGGATGRGGTAAKFHNDRESIERELEELTLMEMANPPEQSEEESSLASSSGKHSSSQQMATESPSVSAKQKTTPAMGDSEIEEQTASAPPQAKATAVEVKTEELEDDKDLEAHLQELLQFNEMANKDILSLSPLESPPPPPPQAEAPKRQTDTKKSNSPPPATKPKPARKAPSPPKQKPTKKSTTSKTNGSQESILSQKTRLPAQTVEVRPQRLSTDETDGISETSSQREPTPPSVREQRQEEKETEEVEIAQKMDIGIKEEAESVEREESVKQQEPVKREEAVKSPTDRKLVFTPPPPPTTPPPTSSPPASAENKSSNEWKIVDTTKTTEAPPTVTVVQLQPQPTSSTSDTDPTTPSKTTPTLATLYTTPLQSKRVNSEGSYYKEEMRSQTSEDIEIIGGMKISRVQRLKWTPKGSLVELVTSPTAPPKGPFQDQIQQHYSYPMQDEEAMMVQQRSGDTQKASKRAEAYQQRYSQPPPAAERTPPVGREDRSNKSKSMYQMSYNMQQAPPQMTSPEKQRTAQWKSQEELRIQHNYQQQLNHYPPAGQQAAGYHHHHQQQQHQQYRPQQGTPQHKQMQHQYSPSGQHHAQHNTGYRQSSVPNGHMGSGGSYQSASLPRSKHEDWRVNRSNTWSAVDRGGAKDGPQAAYAVKAGNPYELCSRCHQTLGGGPVMAIPGAKTQYHLQCFVCRMCRSPLVGTVPKNTLVIMRSRHPHCHRCVANNKDTVMTEC